MQNRIQNSSYFGNSEQKSRKNMMAELLQPSVSNDISEMIDCHE